MKTRFYNLYIPYKKGKTSEYLDNFLNLGFSGFSIVFDNPLAINFSELEDILRYCNKIGVDCCPRLHITSKAIEKSGERNYKKLIFRLRNKFSEKKYIVSIEDSLLSVLTPNEALKFNVITIVTPFFRKIIKLIDKPILFEYIPGRKTLSNSWFRKKLFILKLLLNKNMLFISQNPIIHPIFPPNQISFFIYGLVGDSNVSYNVVSTLPMKVMINSCKNYA